MCCSFALFYADPNWFKQKHFILHPFTAKHSFTVNVHIKFGNAIKTFPAKATMSYNEQNLPKVLSHSKWGWVGAHKNENVHVFPLKIFFGDDDDDLSMNGIKVVIKRKP